MNTNIPSISSPHAASVTNDIRAIRPPVEIPNLWLWVWGTLIVIAVIAAAWFAWRYWRQQLSQPVLVPVIPPHERARQKLQEALPMISQPRPFCVLVSDTIRLYLEERFNFRAPERTTEEFLHELKATNLLLPDQKQSVGDFLSICDMVKFARYEPGQPELEALHGSAVRLIDETEPEPVVSDPFALPSQPTA
ncbi:MAG: hypothetical protein JWR26_1453 [Pedosphaera sp.]|nr:hypothetical protein [Pedosphaera sp.]